MYLAKVVLINFFQEISHSFGVCVCGGGGGGAGLIFEV